jgi:hypothetical protein
MLLKELETKEEIQNFLVGKIIKNVEYAEGYCDIDLIFTDDTFVNVSADDAFDFHVYVEDKKEK